jgi:hypothetical protein
MDGLLQNIITDRSIPEFVKDNYPTFEAFLKAYYEWMEQSKNTLDIAKNLRDYRDIDETIDEFVEYFRKEYLVNIPEEVLADKALLIKQIKNFYLNKGNEESFRFLFRILYNENIEFYYPKKDILRASDGKWYEQVSIKILVTEDTVLTDFESRQLTGSLSGATGIIESILQYTERNTDVAELVLNEVKGTFIAGENIEIFYLDDNGDTQSYTVEIIECFTDISITAGGSAYAKNDVIPIRDLEGTEIGSAMVAQVSRGPVTALNITNGGIGYNGQQQSISYFAYLPINYTWQGIYLPDAPIAAQVTNDYDFYVEQINFPIYPEILDRDNGDFIQISDSPNSSGQGASGLVSLVDDFGTILTVDLLAGGNLYETPTAQVISDTGSGAIIDVDGGGGSVRNIKIEKFPIVLQDDFNSNGFLPYPDFTDSGDGNATGELISGTLLEYPGRWLNEDGHLSSSKKLQDNRFYQDYSYVVKAGVTLNTWKDIVKKIIHPAGLEVFGQVDIFKFKSSKLRRNFGKLIRKIKLNASQSATATKSASMVQKYNSIDFEPTDISGLQTFQDAQTASSLSFSSGSGENAVLSRWDDLSGNDYYLYPNASNVNNFIYKPFGLFGKPALRKSGTQASLECISTTMYSTAVTQIIFFSVLPTATQLTGMIGSLLNSSAKLQITGTRIPSYLRIEASVTNATLPAWTSLSDDMLMLAVSITDASNAKLHNGIDSTSFDPHNLYYSNGGIRLGSLTATNVDPEIEIYGHLLYNTALSDDEMNKMYLWGLRRYGNPS